MAAASAASAAAFAVFPAVAETISGNPLEPFTTYVPTVGSTDTGVFLIRVTSDALAAVCAWLVNAVSMLTLADAMIRIDDELTKGKFKTKLVLQVHDEFVLDAPPAEVEAVKKLVVHAMEHAFDGVMKLDIPLKVNVSTGATWADL